MYQFKADSWSYRVIVETGVYSNGVRRSVPDITIVIIHIEHRIKELLELVRIPVEASKMNKRIAPRLTD